MSETTEPGCLVTIREMLAQHEADECRLTHGSMMAIVEYADDLRSRLESAERERNAWVMERARLTRHRDEAREAVGDARYALECEGGSFGYDAMQRLRRSVEAFDHNYEATTGPCQSPSTSKGETNE